MTVISGDDKSFQMHLQATKMSVTLTNMIEDAGTDNPIPVPSVLGDMLAKVVAYCNYHREDDVDNDQIYDWDRALVKSPTRDLILQLMLAADYLHVTRLVNMCAQLFVANFVRGKTPEELRDIHKIV